MHSLGYFHEFTRTDRDNYVEVFPGLAVDGMQYNFEKYAINYDGYDIGTFDFNSVMMYDSYAFANAIFQQWLNMVQDILWEHS